jgi:23S rRNA pseudouridine1911/1915/1917 synthase
MKYYEPLRHIVSAEEDGWLLKAVLKSRLGLSRRLVTRLKQDEEGITVNGERRFTNVRVHAGDVVEVRMPEEQSADILPEPVPFEIIYEDEHLLIVNKAPGMIVHPTHGHYTGTLANGVVHYWLAQGRQYRFRPVHRLDQDTSGVLAIAKNPYVHQQISEQMKARRTRKVYLAFVWGAPSSPCGTVDAPIGRCPDQPRIRMVSEEGYPAVTHYEVLETYRRASKVRLRLETGRTHQIRVHMQYLGHPLIGDSLYGNPAADSIGAAEAAKDRMPISRQALHAAILGFTHPADGKWREFAAPLPEDMRKLEAYLGMPGPAESGGSNAAEST